MRNSDANIAIDVLNKLIAQELEAASNGIGPAQYEVSLRRIEYCVICGRWWKLYAASSHLTIWTEPPGWVVWLLRHKTRKTMHNQQRKESK